MTNETRQAFLLALTDALRSLSDPVEIESTASRLLDEHLRASRTLCAEIKGEPGAEQGIVRSQSVRIGVPMPERITFADCGGPILAAMRRGEPVVVANVATGARYGDAERAACQDLELGAMVAVTLVKDSPWVAALSVHSAVPRDWTPSGVELVGEVAERTWAAIERARAEAALRRIEARHRKMLAIGTVSVVFFDPHGGITDANDAFLRMLGFSRAELEAGEVRYDRLTPREWRWRDRQTLAELTATGQSVPFEKEYLCKDGTRIWILCAPKMLDECTAVEFIDSLARGLPLQNRARGARPRVAVDHQPHVRPKRGDHRRAMRKLISWVPTS